MPKISDPPETISLTKSRLTREGLPAESIIKDIMREGHTMIWVRTEEAYFLICNLPHKERPGGDLETILAVEPKYSHLMSNRKLQHIEELAVAITIHMKEVLEGATEVGVPTNSCLREVTTMTNLARIESV